MTQAITRLYGSEAQASDAVKTLKQNGYLGDQINLVTGAAGSGDGLVAAIEKGGVPNAHAAIYAERVRAGGAIVSVCPMFGTAQRATEILESFEPVDAGVSDVPVSASKASGKAGGKTRARTTDILDLPPMKDDPTPLSSRFNLPVLLDDPTPFSSVLEMAGAVGQVGAAVGEVRHSRGFEQCHAAVELVEPADVLRQRDAAVVVVEPAGVLGQRDAAVVVAEPAHVHERGDATFVLARFAGDLQGTAGRAQGDREAAEPVSETVAEPAPKKPVRKAAEKAVEQAPDSLVTDSRWRAAVSIAAPHGWLATMEVARKRRIASARYPWRDFLTGGHIHFVTATKWTITRRSGPAACCCKFVSKWVAPGSWAGACGGVDLPRLGGSDLASLDGPGGFGQRADDRGRGFALGAVRIGWWGLGGEGVSEGAAVAAEDEAVEQRGEPEGEDAVVRPDYEEQSGDDPSETVGECFNACFHAGYVAWVT